MNPFFIKELLMEMEKKRWEEKMATAKPSLADEQELPAWLKDYLARVYGPQMRDRPHTMEIAPHMRNQDMKTAIPRFSSPRSQHPMPNIAYPRNKDEIREPF